jgi:hypothetical protein
MNPDLASLSEALKDIDPEKLPHGLEQYKRFGPKTVRAILAVRDLVMHTPALSETKFRIGITSDPKTQKARDHEAGSVKFQIIFESPDQDEARTVEADVRLNFLWHFPGRCLNKGDYRQECPSAESTLFVYVACFPEAAFNILGKA